ncbi:unnamed protein product [Effrenium voratum]|nr:unnamed protein product [Effrenium voratum]
MRKRKVFLLTAERSTDCKEVHVLFGPPGSKQGIHLQEALPCLAMFGENPDISDIKKQIDELVEHLRRPDAVCVAHQDLAQLSERFVNSDLPDQPEMDPAEYLKWLREEVLEKELALNSPHYVGHMATTLPEYMPEMARLVTAANLNLVKAETGKATTFLEREAVAVLHKAIFCREDSFYQSHVQSRTSCLGTLTSGGTTANIQAMWMARNRAFPEAEQKGMFAAMLSSGVSGAVVLASELVHYSIDKAVSLLGLGAESLVKLATEAGGGFRVDVGAMESSLEECRARNQKVLAIVGVAGATETGSVDDLDALAALAARFGCHFHVDAAWAGPLAFTDRDRLKGLERADSVAVDGHKLLFTPLGLGTLLIREPSCPGRIQKAARYIIREDSFDQGRFTLEGSRPAMAIYLHMNLRCLGRSGLAARVNHGCALASHFAQSLATSPCFELITQPVTNIVLYRYIPVPFRTKGPASFQKEMDEFQVLLQSKQALAGRSFVSRTAVPVASYKRQCLVCLRAVFGNMAITTESLDQMLQEQRALARQIEQSLGSSGGESEGTRADTPRSPTVGSELEASWDSDDSRRHGSEVACRLKWHGSQGCSS